MALRGTSRSVLNGSSNRKGRKGGASSQREVVVLLHGLGRTAASMYILKLRLEQQGYRVIAKSYASARANIEAHAVWLDRLLAQELGVSVSNTRLESTQKIHFVTHSMGGIILRQLLCEHAIKSNDILNNSLGRAVMLAPPNGGSEVVDYFRSWKIFKKIVGPAGLQLGTDRKSKPNTLGAVNFEMGVIAGTRSIDPIGSLLIGQPNDGKVSVASAKVEGMTDFVAVARSHTFIMNSSKVAQQIVSFLKIGKFLPLN